MLRAPSICIWQALSQCPDQAPLITILSQGGIATFLARNCEHLDIPKTGYVLKPHLFVLGRTEERINVADSRRTNACGQDRRKSSFARCGLLVHFTALTVHAGFEGTLTLEMIYLGNAGITLYAGKAIAQLILETVLGATLANPSQFQGQTTPAGTSPK